MTVKQFSYLIFCVIFFLFIHSFYRGIITEPGGGDSRDYQIPIAQHIINGTAFSLPDGLNSAIYYPGSSNAILSLFILAHIPLNLFGFVGWILLLYACKKLGEHFGLDKYLSFIFAVGFVTTLSVIRQIHTQSIDMWLALYFVVSILLLEKPEKSYRYFLLLGFFLGMILGSKANGILYLIVFFFVYIKTIWRYLSLTRVLVFLSIFSLVGLSWYIRNYVMYANPLYPAEIPFFKGYPGFPLQDMMMWKTPFIYEDGLYKIVESLISEYLFFAFAFIPVIFIIVKKFKQLIQNRLEHSKLYWLVIGNFFITLLFPIPTINIIPNMRYLFPLIILASLLTFLLAKRYKLAEPIAFLTLINSILVLTHVSYYPKLFIVIGIVLFYLWVKRQTIIERIITR